MRFTLVDKFIELESGKRAVASKTFSQNEDFFADHFPGFPVVPGVLVTETMVQTGGWLILYSLDFSHWPFLCMIDKAKFRRFVRAGEKLRIEASIQSGGRVNFEVHSKVTVCDHSVAEARIFYHLGNGGMEPTGLAQPWFPAWAREKFRELAGDMLRPNT